MIMPVIGNCRQLYACVCASNYECTQMPASACAHWSIMVNSPWAQCTAT